MILNIGIREQSRVTSNAIAGARQSNIALAEVLSGKGDIVAGNYGELTFSLSAFPTSSDVVPAVACVNSGFLCNNGIWGNGSDWVT